MQFLKIGVKHVAWICVALVIFVIAMIFGFYEEVKKDG